MRNFCVDHLESRPEVQVRPRFIRASKCLSANASLNRKAGIVKRKLFSASSSTKTSKSITGSAGDVGEAC